MNNFLKKVTPIAILLFLIFLAVNRTDNFRLNKIAKYEMQKKIWDFDVDIDMKKIHKILSRPFTYLAKGRQCFVFESEDQKYVIKFYDKERFNLVYYFPSIKLPKKLNDYRNKHYFRRKARLLNDLKSLKLAYENLKDDAALEYVHINKTNIFKNKIKIKNKCGKTFFLDLNDVIFVIQKKCNHFFNIFESSKDENYKNHLLLSFLKMVDRRTKNLIIDDDIGRKRRNWAIIDNQVVNIDVGRWYFDEKLVKPYFYKKEMLKATKTLRKYLAEKYPEKLKFLNEKLAIYFDDFEKNHNKYFVKKNS